MVVTASTTDGDAEEDLRRRANDVVQLVRTVLLKVRRLIVPRTEPMKAGGDDRLQRGVRQFVTSKLLNEESVIRLVGVEGRDHIVAIPPNVRLCSVPFIAVRLRIPYQIQPVPRPTLAITRTIE